MEMPNLRKILNEGTSFISTYTGSPQCVPGRAVLFSGRRTDEQGAYNNNMGWGKSSNNKTIDSACSGFYGNKTCEWFASFQNYNYTILDAMIDNGYNVYLYGKVDVGGGIIELPSQSNSTADGFHHGPDPEWGLPIFTRSANIQKALVGLKNPMNITNDNNNNVHHSDWQIASNCIDRLNWLNSDQYTSTKPWFMYVICISYLINNSSIYYK